MIVESASDIRGPVVTLVEREALRGHVLDAFGFWAVCRVLPDGDLQSFAMKWFDGLRLMDDLGWEESPADGTLELTLPVDDLQRTFLGIGESVIEVRDLPQKRTLLVAGVCERVLAGLGAAR
jgi:hypothetical protein